MLVVINQQTNKMVVRFKFSTRGVARCRHAWRVARGDASIAGYESMEKEDYANRASHLQANISQISAIISIITQKSDIYLSQLISRHHILCRVPCAHHRLDLRYSTKERTMLAREGCSSSLVFLIGVVAGLFALACVSSIADYIVNLSISTLMLAQLSS